MAVAHPQRLEEIRLCANFDNGWPLTRRTMSPAQVERLHCCRDIAVPGRRARGAPADRRILGLSVGFVPARAAPTWPTLARQLPR